MTNWAGSAVGKHADEILEDRSALRVPLNLMDASSSPKPHSFGDSKMMTQDEIQKERVSAAYDHMCHSMDHAWKGQDSGKRSTSPNSPAMPSHAKDGRLITDMSASDRAREEMAHNLSNAWR